MDFPYLIDEMNTIVQIILENSFQFLVNKLQHAGLLRTSREKRKSKNKHGPTAVYRIQLQASGTKIVRSIRRRSSWRPALKT